VILGEPKHLGVELLNVKADLERELETWVPNCTKCGLDVHWVSGLGVTPGHWAHREPAPHGEPAGQTTNRGHRGISPYRPLLILWRHVCGTSAEPNAVQN
jgi:hypothetical protein